MPDVWKIGATSTSIFLNDKNNALSIHAWKLELVRASMFFSCNNCHWEKENLVMCIWCMSLGWLVSRSSKLCQSTNVGEYATNHSRVPFSIYNYHQSSSNLSKKSLSFKSMEYLILVSHNFTCHPRYQLKKWEWVTFQLYTRLHCFSLVCSQVNVVKRC